MKKVNKDTLVEYERLKESDLFSTLKGSIISDDTITILVHNVRSLSKHVNDIVSHSRIMNNDIIGLAEKLTSLSDSTCSIVETWNFFNINFNNSDDKFLSLDYRHRNNVAVLDKFDTKGVSIFSFKKHDLADRVFTLKLVYRKHSSGCKNFFRCCNIY